jgi:hypothetical protein
MVSELRKQLEEKTTDELVEMVRAHDLSEWRPEVFRIAESILTKRGVDAPSMKTRTPEPIDETKPAPPDLPAGGRFDGARIRVMGRYRVRPANGRALRPNGGGSRSEPPQAGARPRAARGDSPFEPQEPLIME